MKTAHILQADVLDIIFDNRNKSYGAYPLRKFYNERLYKALGITFLFVCITGIIIFLEKKEKQIWKPAVGGIVLVDVTPIPELLKTVKPLQQVKPPTALPPVKAQVFVSTFTIVDNDANATKLASNLDNVAIASVTNDAGAVGKQIVNADPGPAVGTPEVQTILKTIDKKIPVVNPDVRPQFPGGEDALIRFLQKNLQNPQSLEEGEMVTVKIKFIVGYDGVLKGFETVQDGGKAFNNEVIRVLKKMPDWIPGKNSGENVSVYYTIPVKFIAQD